MPAKKRISAFHYQTSKRSISGTARPFAKPFNGEGAWELACSTYPEKYEEGAVGDFEECGRAEAGAPFDP